MEIKKAEYLISSPSLEQCPKPDRPEYAFIGRSNVGKSSLINMVTGRRNLAKTSSTPGKTRLINHFSVDDDRHRWYLVDLPGYGFAKVSIAERKRWEKMIREYLTRRENLGVVFVLIDSRHEPQSIDRQFIDRLGEWEVPFCLVFTKADKETQRTVAQNVRRFLDGMKAKWHELPPHFITSAEKGLGREALLAYVESMNKSYSEGR
jgi:GTP-binding protein